VVRNRTRSSPPPLNVRVSGFPLCRFVVGEAVNLRAICRGRGVGVGFGVLVGVAVGVAVRVGV
jgi:hypothetical protein